VIKLSRGQSVGRCVDLSSALWNKSLANANRPCGCSVLCLHPKSSLRSCPHGPHYGRVVLFTSE